MLLILCLSLSLSTHTQNRTNKSVFCLYSRESVRVEMLAIKFSHSTACGGGGGVSWGGGSNSSHTNKDVTGQDL